ncbi:MAG: hypothetical protein ACREGR_02130, partial [Minisyncoccia bacterium]
MRRYAPVLLAVIVGLFIIVPTALPLVAHATGVPYWGPLVPPDGSPNQGNVCPDAWGNVLQLINNAIALSITILIIFAAPLLIAYSGFLYLTSGANPSARGQANKVLTSTIIGIVVALAGYIIVDAVLTSLTYQGVSGWTSQVFSNGASTCLSVAQSLNPAQFPSGSTSCGSGTTCQNSQCLPAPQTCGSATCTNGQVCGSDGQTCVYPAGVTCGSTTCSPNQTCNATTNQCAAPQACSIVTPGPGSQAATCSSGTTCKNGNCAVTDASGNTTSCSGTGQSTCTAGTVCSNSVCVSSDANGTPISCSATGASGLNIGAAVNWLTSNVTTTKDSGVCLTDIQYALAAGGIPIIQCPHSGGSGNWAGYCSPTLQGLNFTNLGSSDASPQ